MKMKCLTGASALAVAFMFSSSANAVLLVDRGLPTINLNNAAGANRANVAWAVAGNTPRNYWLVGDTFQNTSSETWLVDTIRLWTVGQTDTAILRGADGESAVGVVSETTYANPGPNNRYQEPGPGSRPFMNLNQIDFAVSITLLPGQTYSFFLDGSGNVPGIRIPSVHASNAALSGSRQDGADELMLFANVVDGTLDPESVVTWSGLGPWDNTADLNVQVFGSAVSASVPDSGSSMALLVWAIGTMGILRRKLVAA
jgi:hypothetical protein